MKSIAAISFALLALALAAPAAARGGCGTGLHRGYYGHCSANKHYRARPLHRYSNPNDLAGQHWRERHNHHRFRPLHDG